MVSDQIIIGSDGTGMKEALAEAERVVRYYELPKKDALKIRLLTEETISMMHQKSVRTNRQGKPGMNWKNPLLQTLRMTCVSLSSAAVLKW